MAFQTGTDCVVLLDNFNLSEYLNNADTKRDRAVPECSTFGTGSRKYVKGIKGGTVSLSGFFDGATGASEEEFDAAFDAAGDQILTVGPVGIAIGAIVRMLEATMSTHGTGIPVEGVVSTSAEFMADGGIDAGRSLKALASITATTDGASVDNAALTSNGGVAHLHVTVNTRSTATTVKVQHSVDDAVWVDLVTFTVVAIGTKTQQRSVVAAGTTVNRYLRAQHTLVAGTGAITSAVAFARR